MLPTVGSFTSGCIHSSQNNFAAATLFSMCVTITVMRSIWALYAISKFLGLLLYDDIICAREEPITNKRVMRGEF